jgi:phosphatidate cytidylyltransferase
MLRQRALSAAILVPPLLVVLVLGGPWIVALIVVATALAAIEVFRLLGAAGYPSVAVLGIALAVGVVLDGAVATELDGSGLILIAVGTILAAVGAFAKLDPREGLPTWFATVFGAIYASLLGFVVRLGNAAPEPPASAPLAFLGGERGWILLLVLGVWAYDTGAYFVGKRFGRAKFLAHISPSKTYAGLVGGLVASTVVVTIITVLLGEPPLVGIALGPLLGLSAQAGDLAESMLKRAAGAKDSGTLIPGHGGILDRVDSFLFAAPVAALYVLAVVR